jgi:hypothetical protein
VRGRGARQREGLALGFNATPNTGAAGNEKARSAVRPDRA